MRRREELAWDCICRRPQQGLLCISGRCDCPLPFYIEKWTIWVEFRYVDEEYILQRRGQEARKGF